MYFWQALPDIARNTGILCLALAGLHTISVLSGQSVWLSAVFAAVANLLQKFARAIRELIAGIWDFFKDDPLTAGIGCLLVVFFILVLVWIISLFAGSAWLAFFDEIDAFSEYLVQTQPADEIFLTQLLLFSPLLVLLLLALFGTAWIVLSQIGKGLGAYAAFISSPSPRQRQSMIAVILLLAGVGMLAGSPWISHTANAQAKAILKSRLASGDLRKLDLQNLNLSGIDLAGANLYRANLSGACLTGANLFDANLENAGLTGACLDKVNLASANLKKSDLRSASLQYAILDDANFWETNLTGADLQNASYRGRGPNSTIMPDGTRTGIAGGPYSSSIYTGFWRFTEQDHPDFWTPGNIPRPDSCQKTLDY